MTISGAGLTTLTPVRDPARGGWNVTLPANGTVGTYTATIYPGARGNFVFNAATCWWADGLSEPPGYVRPSVYTTPRGPDRRAQQITRNLLDRMRRSAWPE